MKFLRFLVTTVIVVGCLGYGAYYLGTNWAADKIVTEVSTELENSGYLSEIKQAINNEPELKKIVEEVATIDTSHLPFTTKEQATRLLIQKVGISELLAIQSKAQTGMTEQEIRTLLQTLEGKLTEEEILALKVIAYNEFMN